ncbi:MAG: B12-binding domain-containing radical SAM protein [Elusimicrobiota bacterium]
MKIALILCPSWDTVYPTFGLASLAASLNAAEHETTIYDLNGVFALLERAASKRPTPRSALSSFWLDPEFVGRQVEEHRRYLDSFVDQVLGAGHRVVGFSTYFTNRLMTLEVARLFKRRDPGVTIIAGGSDCLLFEKARRMAGHDAIDAVVYGEGELALPKLVSRLERTGVLEPAPGVFLSREPSTWKDAQEAPVELDALPFADYDAHRFRTFSRKAVSTSRGCVRKCDFCSEWRTMRFRQASAARLHRELSHQLSRHPEMREFIFGDSLVNGVMSFLESFCDLEAQEPLDIRWQGYAIIRPEMTGSILHELRRTGCDGLFFGVESGSEAVRQSMNKGFPTDVASRVLKEVSSAGIAARIGVIAGHPSETENEFRQSLEFVRANAPAISRLNISVFLPLDQEGEGLGGTNGGGFPWFWRNRDGSNAFPIRIERVRRLARAARSCGVKPWFEGLMDDAIEERCDEMLAAYGQAAL